MTCNILKGYVSETAKNCIANPPWGEGCEVCVSSYAPWMPIIFLLIGIVICFGVMYLVCRMVTQRNAK